MGSILFQSRSAAGNLRQNPAIQKFVVQEKYDICRSFNSAFGFNAGGCEIEIVCESLYRDKHIKFPDGEIRWADIYKLPDGEIMAVRQMAGGAKQIAMLEFYSQKDFGFEVLLDFQDENEGGDW